MVIMRRFKTHSASSSTGGGGGTGTAKDKSSRKSSSVSGLFKSASSPTPPSSQFVSVQSTESLTIPTLTTTPALSAPPTPPLTVPGAQQPQQRSNSGSFLRSYERALNRFQTSLGMNTSSSTSATSTAGTGSAAAAHPSNQSSTEASSPERPDGASKGAADSNLLSVDDYGGQASSHDSSASSGPSTPKAPLSPKLPSRFRFHKNKAKSNSGPWYSSSAGKGERNPEKYKQGWSCPGLLETTMSISTRSSLDESSTSQQSSTALSPSQIDARDLPSTSNKQAQCPKQVEVRSKSSDPKRSKEKTKSKANRPMLIRQQPDDQQYQYALVEKVLQDNNKFMGPLGPIVPRDGVTRKSAKSLNKLKKMSALELVGSDIVCDDNKCIDNVHFNDLFHGTLNDSSSITMPHSIRNDPRLYKDDVDIRFSRTLNSCKLPQIRYASPDRLFERLTDLRFLSIDFLNTFLLTYRVFTDSLTVIESLKRVHYNPEAQIASSMPQETGGACLDEGGRPGEVDLPAVTNNLAGQQHLHPHSQHQQPHHSFNVHGAGSTISGAERTGSEFLSTTMNTIEYDYTRRVSTSSLLSDINELSHRESIVSNSETPAAQQLGHVAQQQQQQQQLFNTTNVIRNTQHWRLSHRKFEEEQARERYMKRMNRNHNSSISSAASGVSGGAAVAGGNDGGEMPNTTTANTTVGYESTTINYNVMGAGEPLSHLAITDPIAVPVPPPPSPEVPGYFHSAKEERSNSNYENKDSGESSGDEGSSADDAEGEEPLIEKEEEVETAAQVFDNNAKDAQLTPHSQSCDTLTAASCEPSTPLSPISSATSSATLVGSDSKSGSPRPSPVSKSPPQKLPSTEQKTLLDNDFVIVEENEECLREEVTPKPTPPPPVAPPRSPNRAPHRPTPPPIPIRKMTPVSSVFNQSGAPSLSSSPKHSLGQPDHHRSSTCSAPGGSTIISSVGSLFANKNQQQQQQQQTSSTHLTQHRHSTSSQPETRSNSIAMSGLAASGRLSATSTTLTMNYLRVRGSGSKRGSGSSESEVPGSNSITPRSSFQTDATGISTPRSSFQHPDSPQMSSKAGVVVTSSRQTSRRSSTASAASAFAVATAASSNPPEPLDPILKQHLQSRGNSRFSSAAGADLKLPLMAGGGTSGGSISGASGQAAAANSAARSKRESMISTAATMRVLNVLRHWVSKHSQDFENDQQLLKVTSEFLDELVHNSSLLPAEHKAAVQLQQMIAKQTMEAKEKLDLDILLSPPMQVSIETFDKVSALTIAETMTYIDHNIFVRIQSEEFLGQAWMKEDKAHKAPHILLMTKHFNDISRLVASEVLHAPELQRRVSIVEKWAAVADICRCFHNFNGVLQICAAFTNSSVYRLKRTWEKVPKTVKQTIDKLQTLVSTDGRFRNMREALHRCDPPCIPYLGMYLTDLSFIEEGTPNFTDENLLNFSKMRMIAHVIREIRHFQQTPYKLELNPHGINYLMDHSRHMMDEEMYQISLCLEPRLSRMSTSKIQTSPIITSPLSGQNLVTTPSHEHGSSQNGTPLHRAN